MIEEAVETLRMLKEIRTANCDFSRYQLRIEKAEKALDTFLAMRADGEISKEFSYTYAYPENDGDLIGCLNCNKLPLYKIKNKWR